MRSPFVVALAIVALTGCAQGPRSATAPARTETASLFERGDHEGEEARGEQELAHPAARPGDGKPRGVVLYGASWCGACHQAAAFLRARGVAFVEHDIERDANARSEMQSKCASARLACTGIPVIDVNGQIFQGFDAEAVLRALGR